GRFADGLSAVERWRGGEVTGEDDLVQALGRAAERVCGLGERGGGDELLGGAGASQRDTGGQRGRQQPRGDSPNGDGEAERGTDAGAAAGGAGGLSHGDQRCAVDGAGASLWEVERGAAAVGESG